MRCSMGLQCDALEGLQCDALHGLQYDALQGFQCYASHCLQCDALNTPPPLIGAPGAVRHGLVRGSGGGGFYKSPANMSKSQREFLAQTWGQIKSLFSYDG